tara:strand:+ start:2423 stop:2962 length:540 start_codon:yes stop_codon:yes gene_type:complete
MPSAGIGSKVVELGSVPGTGTTKTYWFYANDNATVAAPIVHGAGSATTFLTNNSLGTRTFAYNPRSKPNVWNPVTGKFDFTSLKIGDIINFRVDLVIDHAAAQELNLIMSLAEGEAAPYELNLAHEYYKTASTNVTVTAFFKLPFIGQQTVDGGARIRFSSIAAASIVVEGWFYEITEV